MSNTESKTVKVITAVVDTVELKLYLQNGDTVSIKQGDPRVKRIIDEITPILVAGGVAEVDVNFDRSTQFADFEEKTGGFVKFFRVAKKKLNSFLNRTEALFVGEHVPPQAIGRTTTGKNTNSETAADPVKVEVPVVAENQEDKKEAIERLGKVIKELTPAERMKQATDDILKHAVPVTSHHFSDHQVADDQDDHALVAVVGDKVVPNAQHLHTQIKHVNDGGDSTGLVKLIERVSKIKRGHSVDDLMKFLKRGDLPIANNGDIIIYKRLQRVNNELGSYVDVHSRKVFQRVGDYVHMAEALVDHNRRVDCSNGLHVARRSYLSGFSGDVMIIASVRPEDVIAVPEYDANKMRVCGYHILFEVPAADAKKLIADRPITKDDETAKLLARAIAGDFPAATRGVEITGHKGDGLVFKDLGDAPAVKHEPKDLAPVGAIEDNSEIAIDRVNGEKVDPSKLVETVTPKVVVKPEGRKEQVARLLDIIVNGATNLERTDAAHELSTLRKKWKQSWAALEVSDKVVTKIEKALAGAGLEPAAPTPVKQAVKKASKAPKAIPAPAPAPKVEAPAAGPSARIAALLPAALDGDEQAANEIFTIKKAAKKAWDKLGVSDVNLRKLTLVAKK